MLGMTSIDELSDILQRAFPVEPLPHRFFRGEPPQDEFSDALRVRLQGRRWTEVSMLDWRMVAATPVARDYMEPSAYRYYLPSLMLGGLEDLQFLDWALEAILPGNQHHVPRGTWWSAFVAAMSRDHRRALQAFLGLLRSRHWDEMGLDGREMTAKAEALWSAEESP